MQAQGMPHAGAKRIRQVQFACRKMKIANVPAVFLGDKLSTRIAMRLVHGIAAAIFALLGIATLLGLGADFGL